MKPYYSHAGITIYHGDCREVLPGLCAHGFDAFVTDPQYGVGESYENGCDDLTNVDCGLWALTYLRGTAGTGALTPGVKNMWMYPRPVWIGSFFYPSATGLGPWGFVCWQPILYYGTDPYAGSGSRPDSLWSTEAAEKNGHPCPKPIGQWKWLVNRVTLPGQLILDPFMGSGTTLRAAKDLGRRAIGIEIEEKYCEIAAKRLAQSSIFEQSSTGEVILPPPYVAPIAKPPKPKMADYIQQQVNAGKTVDEALAAWREL